MDYSVSLISYYSAAFLYFALLIRSLPNLKTGISNKLIAFSAFITCIWFLILATQLQLDLFDVAVYQSLEIIKYAAWIAVLLSVLYTASHQKLIRNKILLSLTITAFTINAVLLSVTMTRPLLTINQFSFIYGAKFYLICLTVLSILGLALVEQVMRNTHKDHLWNIKFLCLAIGGMFAYDFFMFSDALLLNHIEESLLTARGFIQIFLVPLLFITISRNPVWRLKLAISRRVVFHTGTLAISGVYLILMATAGYYIKATGGEWGNLLQTIFFIAAILAFFILIMSRQMRAKLVVYISRHFFRYHYDYRHEWVSMTKALFIQNQDENLAHRALTQISLLVNSSGGGIWIRNEDNIYVYTDDLNANWDYLQPNIDEQDFIIYMKDKNWIIDIDEYKEDQKNYPDLTLPNTILSLPNAWLIIPLNIQTTLVGFIVLQHSHASFELNWEDYDILKISGHQAASALAQMLDSEALAKSRQFDAYNQMSAFVIHDIKTVVSQLSLMVNNAEQHRTNPAFIDDMIKTTEHSVYKMQGLLKQLKRETQLAEQSKINLSQLLADVVYQHHNNKPVPQLTGHQSDIHILASYDHIHSAITHIIKNAQEATSDDGYIKISLSTIEHTAIIKISDNGIGMDTEFIKNNLFKPFSSTKGLSGMGIGVYQCRQYIRAANGDISVDSKLNKGTAFTITLPIYTQE
ncbi:MAG: PEP-CTERM system histidine kinase PrsK [Gammaproteobacteria bacterium]|nr:PEP-CTERM system histidine kinase PrsK [Gammaproteobacteria bacterium]